MKSNAILAEIPAATQATLAVNGGGSSGEETCTDFSDNFSAAVAGFSQIVGAVDQINPGVRDKYLPN